MRRRNGPVVKSVESVLRPKQSIRWERFVSNVGFEPGVLPSCLLNRRCCWECPLPGAILIFRQRRRWFSMVGISFCGWIFENLSTWRTSRVAADEARHRLRVLDPQSFHQSHNHRRAAPLAPCSTVSICICRVETWTGTERLPIPTRPKKILFHSIPSSLLYRPTIVGL